MQIKTFALLKEVRDRNSEAEDYNKCEKATEKRKVCEEVINLLFPAVT